MCAIAFAIIVLFICVSFIVKYININNILNNANSTKQKLLQLENYSIYTTSHHIDYKNSKEAVYSDEYYYKDGKYKKISKTTSINYDFDSITTAISYGIVDTNEQKTVIEAKKEIIEYKTNYIQVPKSRKINRMYESINFYFQDFGFLGNLYINSSLAFQNNLRTERFQGRECYVLKTEEKDSYNEIWIDKETLIPIRTVQDIYGKEYDERIISFYKDNVKDEDVTFNQSQYDGYTIISKEDIIEEEKGKKFV